MTLALKQSSSQDRKGAWHWSVWLEGTAAELAAVDHVIYHLHPSFPDAIRTVRDRKSQFKIEDTAFTEFEITAHVAGKRAKTETLKAWLGFARKEEMSVFLSFSRADAPVAQALTAALAKQGIGVTTGDLESIPAALRGSSAIVVMQSDKQSPWTKVELEAAVERGIDQIAVTVGDQPGERHLLQLKTASDAPAVAKQIAAKLRR